MPGFVFSIDALTSEPWACTCSYMPLMLSLARLHSRMRTKYIHCERNAEVTPMIVQCRDGIMSNFFVTTTVIGQSCEKNVS